LNLLEFKENVKNGLMKKLVDKRYENFLNEFNVVFTSRTRVSKDYEKINKILVNMSNHQVHKVYKIIKLMNTLIEEHDNDNGIHNKTSPNQTQQYVHPKYTFNCNDNRSGQAMATELNLNENAQRKKNSDIFFQQTTEMKNKFEKEKGNLLLSYIISQCVRKF
jgi:hypothetical protein